MFQENLTQSNDIYLQRKEITRTVAHSICRRITTIPDGDHKNNKEKHGVSVSCKS